MQIRQLLESRLFQNSILILILFNMVVLGLETVPSMRPFYSLLMLLDQIIIGAFIIELTLKIAVYRSGFFKSGWNCFDLVVVLLTLPFFAGSISVLRALRIFRAMRLFSIIPKFQIVANGFFAALSSLASVIAILLLLLYMAAVIAAKLFGASFPVWFGSLAKSLFSMFQIMTLEGWADIVRAVLAVYPYAWGFFLPFIVITTFIAFNLLIGVIVNSMQNVHHELVIQTESLAEDNANREERILHELKVMREEMSALKQLIQKREDSHE